MYLLSNILFLYTLNFDIMILIKKGRGNNMKIIDICEAYAKEWNTLVEINSELRVLENGEIKNKKYSDYYDIILNTLKEIAPCKISILIAECMGKEVLNNTGDLVYLTLIDKLIDLNKIKIVEKGTRHFVDTIDLSKN